MAEYAANSKMASDVSRRAIRGAYHRRAAIAQPASAATPVESMVAGQSRRGPGASPTGKKPCTVPPSTAGALGPPKKSVIHSRNGRGGLRGGPEGNPPHLTAHP